MLYIKRILNSSRWVLPGLFCTSSVLASEQASVQPYLEPWWHAMPMPFFGWIFPFMFFVMIICVIFFMMRKGGMGCMWHNRMMDKPSESALEILDKRYAKGEIDKQEYDDKKAAITASS